MKNQLKRAMQSSKAITLISLVITIIILLILSVVVFASLGPNGLVARAKQARSEHDKNSATELLKMKMANCQLECILDKNEYPTLAYLAAFLQEDINTKGDIEYVQAESRNLASLDETPYLEWEKIYTKFTKYPFEFEIDSSFKVSVNGEEVSVPEGYMRIPTETLNIIQNGEYDVTDKAKVNVNVESQNSESTIISDFSIKNSSLSIFLADIDLDGTITTSDLSDISGYIIIINDKPEVLTKTLPCSIKLERNKEYIIKVKAIDKNCKLKEATNILSITTPNQIISALEYPVITTNGVANVKYINPEDENDYTYGLDLSVDCTAADALDKKAYDGDETTYVEANSGKIKFKFGSDIDIYYVLFKTDATSGHLYDGYGWIGINNGNDSGFYNGYYYTKYYGKGSNYWKSNFATIGVRMYEIKYDTTIP